MPDKGAFTTISDDIDWLSAVIDQVIKSYFLQEGHEADWAAIAPPDLRGLNNPYAMSVMKWELSVLERLALVLAIVPHIQPEVLDIFFGKNKIYDRGFSEFGGVIDKTHSGFIPTGQTFFFLATAVRPEWKFDALAILSNDGILVKEQVLIMGNTEPGLPRLCAILGMDTNWLHYFITGEEVREENTPAFPAQKINTRLSWEDVVLDDQVYEQVMEIRNWMEFGDTLMNDWNLKSKIKPGYRALFYGPPGTGKTLTASLLGKSSGRDVYKIDLSMIVSKYIGETEKNLSAIFNIARHKNWILFFDEADALFGKRTAANSSNDRFANQQTAYLLQRIEDFPGVVILATNLKANIDEAFSRRFQSMIYFNMPGPEDRYRLWKNAFDAVCTLHPDINLKKIAEEHELAGGAIINILRNCALAAISRKDTVVQEVELYEAIRRELKKDNKTLDRRS